MLMSKVVLLLALLGSVQALPSHGGSWYRYALDVLKNKEHIRETQVDQDPSMHWFTQSLDHFDRQVTRTWQQRSFQNDTFFDGTGPVFLCVGGEGPPLDASVLINSVHCSDMTELAPQVGALMVAVEHRYYGDSMPTGRELVNQKLRWLSSQQALGDLAEFHSQIVANYSLSDNKWVSFGGSYPGMMSGFFRLKYPNLVHASVSSSSPWNALLDMQQYQDIVGDSLAITSVGGSDACKQVVVSGHAVIADMIATADGRASLAVAFNMCDPDALATEAIAGEWAGSGVIEVPSQENDPSCTTPACDIGSICDILLNSPSDNDDGLDENVARLVAVSAAQNNGQCVLGWTQASMDSAVQDAFLDVYSSARSWPYQTCTEFGFYSTCEFGSRCPFVQGYINVTQQVSKCQRMFNIAPDSVEQQIASTNACYGADQPKGSRILFPNGNVDPWSGCGVLSAPTADEPVMLVEGSSHHFWTHPADQITQDTVKDAKVAIQQQVVAWLAIED